MNAFSISPMIVEQLGWVLMHSLWQFAVVGFLTAIILRMLRRHSANTRYFVLSTSILLMVMLPLSTWTLLPDSTAVESPVRFSKTEKASANPSIKNPPLGSFPLVSAESPSQDFNIPFADTDGPNEDMQVSGLPPRSQRTNVPTWFGRAITLFRPWLRWLVAAWCIGFVLFSLRPLMGWRTIRRLRRVGVSPVPDEVSATVRRVTQQLGVRRAVSVFCSSLTQVPMVVGYLRPVVLLPVSLVTSIPAAQLEAILAHELAHIRRHDFLVNLLQTLVETVFFYHPAVWWLSKSLRAERENCCDDLVIATLDNRLEYGRALLAIEELRGQSSVLAIGATDGSLLARVRRIAEPSSDQANHSVWPVLNVAVFSVVVALAISILGFNARAQSPVALVSSPVAVELTKESENEEPLFTEELSLQLKRKQAHGDHWFFIDLDRGRLATPPFPVEIDTRRMPYFVIQPHERKLNAWLVQQGIDLILYSKAKPLGNGSGRMNQQVQLRSVRTNLKSLTSGLQQRPNESWTWKTQPQDVVDLFARKDETTHVSGFVPDSSSTEVRGDSPVLHPFRTAENLLGLFLLEQPRPLKDELKLRIVHVYGATTPLADIEYAKGDFVSGKNGPAEPQRPSKPLVAKLPDGLSVEFVGITKNTAPAEDGWGADGLPIGDDVGYWPATNYISGNTQGISNENGPHPEPNEGAIDLLFRFHGLKSQPSFCFDLATKGCSYSQLPFKDPYKLRVTTERREPTPAGGKSSIPDGEMRIGLAVEPWGKWMQISPTGEILNPLTDHDRYRSTYELLRIGGVDYDRTPNKKALAVQLPRGWRKLFALEMRGIDLDGKEQWVLSWESQNIDKTDLVRQLWGLATSEKQPLAGYEFRLRPYRHWATFENVSVAPGKKSDVQFSTETISTRQNLASAATATQPEPEWGEVMNGLRTRVFPVHSSMSEDEIDTTQQLSVFQTPEDVAFVVEFENVTDKPIILAEPRYGESYGKAKGKAASDWLGQFLFSIDYFAPDGKLIESPEVEQVRPLVHSGLLSTKLDPQQTHRILLRPAKWMSVMSQCPKIGKQRAVVKYLGITKKIKSEVARLKKRKPLLDAVEGEIVAPALDFEVRSHGYRPTGAPPATADHDAAKKENGSDVDPAKFLSWGSPVNGLRTALEVIPETGKQQLSPGTKPTLRLHVENVGDKPVSLASLMWLSELPITATNVRGENVKIGGTWYSGVTPVVRIALKPKQVVTFDAGNIGLAISDKNASNFKSPTNRTLATPSGKYSFQATERFGLSFSMEDGDGNLLVPTETDWKGELHTGLTRIHIEEELPSKKATTNSGPVKFELQAVAFASVESTDGPRRSSEGWWRPDGTRLEAAPAGLKPISVAKQRYRKNFREFLFRVNVEDPELARQVRKDGVGVLPWNAQRFVAGKWNQDGSLQIQLVKSFMDESPSQMSLYFSSLPLVKGGVVELDGDLTLNTQADENTQLLLQQLQLVGIEKLKNETIVTFKSRRHNEHTQIVLEATDHQGQTSQAVDPTKGQRFVIKRPSSEIAKIAIRLRPMTHAISIQGIAMRPGQVSKMKTQITQLDSCVDITYASRGKTLGMFSDTPLAKLEEMVKMLQHDLNTETGAITITTRNRATFTATDKLLSRLKDDGWQWPRLGIRVPTIECDIVDAVTGKPVEGTTVNFRFIKPKSDNKPEEIVSDMFWGPKAPSRVYFQIPAEVMDRPDRNEIEFRWSVGQHDGYEPFATDKRLKLKPFLKGDPKPMVEALTTIKLTPKKKTTKTKPPPRT